MCDSYQLDVIVYTLCQNNTDLNKKGGGEKGGFKNNKDIIRKKGQTTSTFTTQATND